MDALIGIVVLSALALLHGLLAVPLALGVAWLAAKHPVGVRFWWPLCGLTALATVVLTGGGFFGLKVTLNTECDGWPCGIVNPTVGGMVELFAFMMAGYVLPALGHLFWSWLVFRWRHPNRIKNLP